MGKNYSILILFLKNQISQAQYTICSLNVGVLLHFKFTRIIVFVLKLSEQNISKLIISVREAGLIQEGVGASFRNDSLRYHSAIFF